ncbi:hypothetical protein M011DRAFT_472830 [Sporormia fimetaria CBS 119925]|uniref:Uncharacterized protein n=1 Tax=Sporormia fimetaria CBS 119925 TaxID=1340428 RepID=A0A6A6UWH4_9PLEO|nr:hypothetical protein M011DRAFT_472830 [Sporormia fimetaria CBS 119925]
MSVALQYLKKRLYWQECILCHFPGHRGENVVLVPSSKSTRQAVFGVLEEPLEVDSLWPKEPEVFLCHHSCVKVIRKMIKVFPGLMPLQTNRNVFEALSKIYTPTTIPRSFQRVPAVDIMRESLCRKTLSRILLYINQVGPRNTCSCTFGLPPSRWAYGRSGDVTSGKDSCGCITSLIRLLNRLPDELLSNHIAPFLESGDLPRLIIICGSTFNLLSPPRPELCICSSHQPPELPRHGPIFGARFKLGSREYFEALNDHEKPNSLSTGIRPKEGSFKYVVVERDYIAVTGIKFIPRGDPLVLSSYNSSTRHSAAELWTCILDLDNVEGLHVEWTGRLLKRIIATIQDMPTLEIYHWRPVFHTMPPRHLSNGYNCSSRHAQDEASTSRSPEFYLDYASLKDVRAISVAMCGPEIWAITHHNGDKRDSHLYGKVRSDAVWVYCPIPAGGVLQVWWLRSYTQVALVLRTQDGPVWLSSYVPFFDFTSRDLVSSSPPTALCYRSYRGSPIHQVECLRDPSKLQYGRPNPPAPELPSYRTTVPDTGDPEDWIYSDAPLEGVVEAETCSDKSGWCIGILFRYNDGKELVVGEYRLDRRISTPFTPRSILYENRGRLLQARVELLDNAEEDAGDERWEMTGRLVWWHQNVISNVEIVGGVPLRRGWIC